MFSSLCRLNCQRTELDLCVTSIRIMDPVTTELALIVHGVPGSAPCSGMLIFALSVDLFVEVRVVLGARLSRRVGAGLGQERGLPSGRGYGCRAAWTCGLTGTVGSGQPGQGRAKIAW